MPTSSPRQRASRSRCAVYDCSTCGLHLSGDCLGCARGNVRLLHDGASACAIYACVRKLGVVGCYECTESPCRVKPWPAGNCPLRGRFGESAGYEQFREALEVTKGLAIRSRQGSALARGATERVRIYLQVIDEYAERGLLTVSSHHLARAVGVRSGLVRRDLATLGHFGTPGRGYEVEGLRRAIRRGLKLEHVRPAMWLGTRRLQEDRRAREALATMNCWLVAVFDPDPSRIGTSVAGLLVLPLEQAPEEARATGTTIAVVACQEAARPEMVQELAQAGVKAVLNLTAVPLPASAQVVIEQADVGSQLLRLLSRLGPVEGKETA